MRRAVQFQAPIACHESCGWEPAGPLTFHLPDGSTLGSGVYLGPPLPGQ